jgi:flagellar motility protein MotE (MotC chaperone)
MKIRILPLLGFLFAFALVSRAFALSDGIAGKATDSSDQVPPVISKKADDVTEDQTHNEIVAPSYPKQCLSGDVLVSLNNKMTTLNEREADMKEKETAFKAIQIRLDKQLVAIETAKTSLDESIFNRTKLAQEDIAHLTLMYQSMKPKQAAKIFDEMDVNFAAGFIREMKGSQAGLILSNMQTKKAYRISLVIASRGKKYRN